MLGDEDDIEMTKYPYLKNVVEEFENNSAESLQIELRSCNVYFMKKTKIAMNKLKSQNQNKASKKSVAELLAEFFRFYGYEYDVNLNSI